MKYLLLTAISFLILIIFLIVSTAIGSVRESERESKIIENCIKQKDKKIETIGSPWAKQYLVCNPK